MAVLTAQRGLVTQSSELSRPDGAMTIADNVVIDSDNTVQQRRGLSEYSQSEFSQKIQQLISYKDRILVHSNNTISVDVNNNGNFTALSGTIEEIISGYRLKYVGANSNIYFTSKSGIKKISVKNSSDLASAQIKDAGGIKGIDLSAKAIIDPSGFLPAQSKVSYRVIYGTKDANGNIVEGSPTARAVVTNYSQAVKKSEIFTVNVLNHSALSNSEYFLFSVADQGYFVWINKSGTPLAPVTADTLDRIGIEANIQGSVTDSDAAAMIANAIMNTAGSVVNAQLTGTEIEVTVISAGDVSDASQGNISSANIKVTKIFDGYVVDGTPAKVSLNFTLPSIITTEYYYQIYRTGVQTVSEGVSLNDIDPGDEHQFVFEAPILSTDISNGEITIEDNTPETFRASGAYLYTNPVNGQGIINANERPPIALDMAVFRNATFYANTTDVHRLQFSLLSVDNFLSGTTQFYIGQGNKSTSYTFIGIQEVTEIQTLSMTNTVGSSYKIINSANNETSYYIWLDKGSLSYTFNSTLNVSGNTITVVSNKFATNDAITFSGTVPVGITVGTTYYAIKTGANTIQVASTPNGSAISLTPVVGTASVNHTSSDPVLTGKIGVRIPLSLYDDTVQGSTDALIESLQLVSDFSVLDAGSGIVQITCTESGDVTDPSDSVISSGWTHTVTVQGDGEEKAAREVLLSTSTSPAIAIDSTARSLVKVINSDQYCPVFATYLSGVDDLPGQIMLEAKSMQDITFYIAISDSALSGEFNPELTNRIRLISVDNSTNIIQTSSAHGLTVGTEIYIHDNPDSTPVELSGVYKVGSVPSPTELTLDGVDIGILQAGPLNGNIFRTLNSSDNNKAPNRVYYSKVLQPEAVPLLNYIDIGSKDKAILRILALQDSLFVLKEDGIYAITGQTTSDLSVRVVDLSAILIAPDSAVVLNNLIYALTTQGVVNITDTGVSIISRAIENLIKKVTTFAYNYKYTSFGMAYESDRAYLLWLPTTTQDVNATQCFRYNSITNTWTRWIKSTTCGLIKFDEDRIFIGGADRKFVLRERKDLARQDYADRDFTLSIPSSAFSTDTNIRVSSASNLEIGDVIVQNQYVSIARFNRLLKVLDRDAYLNDSDYLSTLQASTGDDMSNLLIALASKLNADSGITGTIPSPSGVNTYTAIRDDFNAIINALNNPSSGTAYKAYKTVNDLLSYEACIVGVNKTKNTIDINLVLPLLKGDIQAYKAIVTEVQWASQHFGKPDITKQIPDGTIIFDQNTIYSGVVSYSTDRSSSFEDINFTASGPGFWGSYNWCESSWGGAGNDVPVRTLIPIDKSRCRYINVKFKHYNAREAYKLIGISLEPREVSTRGYR